MNFELTEESSRANNALCGTLVSTLGWKKVPSVTWPPVCKEAPKLSASAIWACTLATAA